MAKTLCKIVGVVLLLVGVIGFFVPDLAGMHLSTVHNVVHLLTGALASYFGFAGSLSSARSFSLLFGAVYLLLGLLGFVSPEVVSGLIQAHDAAGSPASTLHIDSVVHLLVGAIFLGGGLLSAKTT